MFIGEQIVINGKFTPEQPLIASVGPNLLPPPAVPKVWKRKTGPQASIKAGNAAFRSVFFVAQIHFKAEKNKSIANNNVLDCTTGDE